jgi:hypothetical protein
VSEQVVAQVDGVRPVQVLPTHGAVAVLLRETLPQREQVLVEDLASLRDAVTERAVEVEEYGFDGMG